MSGAAIVCPLARRRNVVTMRSFRYRVHDTTGDDLGLSEHPAPNLETGDVLVLADGRGAVVTARVEAEQGWGQLVALELAHLQFLEFKAHRCDVTILRKALSRRATVKQRRIIVGSVEFSFLGETGRELTASLAR
jgi:hypothetical protein